MRSTASIKSHPIHPMLVSFPIGLFVTGLVFDAVGAGWAHPSLWAAGWYCIVAGILGGAAAAVPGVIDLLTVVPPNSSGRKRGWTHGLLNATVLLVFIVVAAYRGGPNLAPNRLAFLLEVCGVALLGVSGWLGGTLVYRNQIGIDRRYAGAGKLKVRELDSWDRPACNQSELGQGQLMLVEVGSERVVIGRCPDGMAAFSDHCTHRGGPLADGALIGCTVQCPWHGSQFDVHTGRVVAGPAERKIATYNVEIRGGEVYIVPMRATDQPKAA